MNNIETLKQWVDESSMIVFFGGAGCSTESGVPDFRSENGLFRTNVPISTVICCLVHHTDNKHRPHSSIKYGSQRQALN